MIREIGYMMLFIHKKNLKFKIHPNPKDVYDRNAHFIDEVANIDKQAPNIFCYNVEFAILESLTGHGNLIDVTTNEKSIEKNDREFDFLPKET